MNNENKQVEDLHRRRDGIREQCSSRDERMEKLKESYEPLRDMLPETLKLNPLKLVNFSNVTYLEPLRDMRPETLKLNPLECEGGK